MAAVDATSATAEIINLPIINLQIISFSLSNIHHSVD